MPSEYKNAKKDDILCKLVELADERFSFNQPLLQGDNFWIYCNARRYFGTYGKALSEAGSAVPDGRVKSELGNRIDWWPFVESHNQREWLKVVLKALHTRNMNLTAKALKESDYFDLYTDAMLLFGKYSTALAHADVPAKGASATCCPRDEGLFRTMVEIYTCPDQRRKCELWSRSGIDMERIADTLDERFADCHAIVDGANVAYVVNKPSLENVALVDRYLQERGFNKDNIAFIFDASFPYKINPQEFDEAMQQDRRWALAPAKEEADLVILQKALEQIARNPGHPPLIVSNDQYAGHFERHPELGILESRKRGVTWTFLMKRREPVISLLGL